MLDKYEGNFPKLSKSNSLVVDGLMFYMKKLNGSYIAWEYKSKIKIVATDNKERLIDWLYKNIKEIQGRLSENKNI
jgi:hypothetical protein